MTTATTTTRFEAILSAAIPAPRAGIRRVSAKDQAAAIRSLFRELGIKGVRVTTPSYAHARGVSVRLPEAEEHDRSWEGGHDDLACEMCRERGAAIGHVRDVILGAFPDMDDRSDVQVDYFDDPIRIS